MAKLTGKLSRRDMDDPKAPRRPAHEVLGVFGGGSPYGSTRYKARRLCPFEDGLITVAKLRPTRTHEALDVGWIAHAGWEAYYRVIQTYQKTFNGIPKKKSARAEFLWGALPEAERAAVAVVEAFRTEKNYGYTYETAAAIILQYVDRYRREDWWEVVACEETIVYEEELPEPMRLYNADGSIAVEQTHWRYSARLDILVIDHAPGRYGLYDVECKTTKMITEDLIHGYMQDMQVLGQQWLIENCLDLSELPPFKGVLVNIASKHKIARFERVHCFGNPGHLAAWENSTRTWAFANAVLGELNYPKSLGSCAGALRGYSKCAFFDLCSAYPERTIDDFKTTPPPLGFYRDEQKEQTSDCDSNQD